MSVPPISRLNPAITVIAVNVGILVVDEFVDDVELGVVGVESAFKFSIGALMTEHPAVLDDVGNFVATGPGVGLVFEVAEGEVGELIENVAGVVGWFVPLDRFKGTRLEQDVFQHGVSPMSPMWDRVTCIAWLENPRPRTQTRFHDWGRRI